MLSPKTVYLFNCPHQPGPRISGIYLNQFWKLKECPCLDQNLEPKTEEARLYHCAKLANGNTCPYVANGHTLAKAQAEGLI